MTIKNPFSLSGFGVSGIIAAALLASGTYGAGWHIADGLENMKRGERQVSIRGVAEEFVVADSVGWTINFTASGDALATVLAKIQRDQTTIVEFLTAYGFTAEEITPGRLSVVDLLAQQYRTGDVQSNRYIITASVQVRSNKVDSAVKANRSMTELVKKEVVLAESAGPQYRFTKLNDVKPAMLASATQEARKAADEFVKTSGASLGELKTASQGLFSIEGRDETVSESEQVDKKVRVVTTLEYFLAD